MTNAGVDANAARKLAGRAKRSVQRAIQHAPSKVEPWECGAVWATTDAALVERRPQAPNLLKFEVGQLLGDDRVGATCEAVAIAGAGQCGFKERLRSNVWHTVSTTSAGRLSTSQRCFD